MADETSQLQEYLEHRLGRRVSIEELLDATGLTRSTFYRRKKTGFTQDDILNASRFFELQYVDVRDELEHGNWSGPGGSRVVDSVEPDRYDNDRWPPAVIEWLDALAPLIDALPDRSRARTMSEVVGFLNDAIRADQDRFRPAARKIGQRLTSAPDFSSYQAASRGEIDPEDHPEH